MASDSMEVADCSAANLEKSVDTEFTESVTVENELEGSTEPLNCEQSETLLKAASASGILPEKDQEIINGIACQTSDGPYEDPGCVKDSSEQMTSDLAGDAPEDTTVQIMMVADDGSLVPIAGGSSIAILTDGGSDENREGVSIGVQANDYEIERRSGRLPARQRLIPHKFRDYKNPDLEEEDEDDADNDTDYKPAVDRPARRSFNRGTGRRPGRPRKSEMKKDEQESESVVEEESCNKIERSGKLPDRRSLVPKRFRDYESTDKIANIKIEKAETISTITENKDDESKENSEESQNGDENTDGQGEHSYTSKKQTNSSAGSDTELMPRKRGRPPKDPSEPKSPSSKIFKCEKCNKGFSQKGNMRVHMRIHNNEKPYQCKFEGCNRSFRCHETLKRHNLAHMGIKMFKCDICEQSFSSNVALKEHTSRHTDTKSYKCDHCGRFFRQISCLRRHIITHTSETPYSCEVCGKKFSQTVYLRSHMRMHTGEKPFACTKCNKAFSHLSDLNRHKIIHTGAKPYACEYCSASFSDPSSRRRHEREHNGIKPYVCQLCGDQFKRAGQMKAHLTKKHGGYAEQLSKHESLSVADGVIITKQGLDNSLQIVFQENTPPEIVQQLIAPQLAPSIVEVCTSALEEQNRNILSQQGSQVLNQQVQLSSFPHQEALQATNALTAVTVSDAGKSVSTQSSQFNILPQVTVTTTQSVDGQPVLHQSNQGQPVIIQSGNIQQDSNQSEQNPLEMSQPGQAQQVINQSQHVQQVQILSENVQQVINQSEHVHNVINQSEHAEQVNNQSDHVQQVIGQSGQSETVVHHSVQEQPIMSDSEAGQQILQVIEQMESEEPLQVSYEIIDIEERPAAEQSINPDSQRNQNTIQGHNMGQSVAVPSEGEANPTPTVMPTVCQTYETIRIEGVNNPGAHMAADSQQPQSGQIAQVNNSENTTMREPNLDFITNPDFNSQEYYNWLSNFTELCKMVPMPLDVSLFQNISQVHKTLSDILATPSGVLANKENFRILMNISRDMNNVINEHLTHVLQNLDSGE